MKLIYPLLVIGPNAFKNIDRGGFDLISLLDGFKENLDILSKCQHKDILLSDYAALTPMQKTVLLKFVEDYSGRLILYSSVDCIDRVVLSRFICVIKDIGDVVFESESQESEILNQPYLYPVYFCNNIMSRKVLGNVTWI